MEEKNDPIENEGWEEVARREYIDSWTSGPVLRALEADWEDQHGYGPKTVAALMQFDARRANKFYDDFYDRTYVEYLDENDKVLGTCLAAAVTKTDVPGFNAAKVEAERAAAEAWNTRQEALRLEDEADDLEGRLSLAVEDGMAILGYAWSKTSGTWVEVEE